MTVTKDGDHRAVRGAQKEPLTRLRTAARGNVPKRSVRTSSALFQLKTLWWLPKDHTPGKTVTWGDGTWLALPVSGLIFSHTLPFLSVLSFLERTKLLLSHTFARLSP